MEDARIDRMQATHTTSSRSVPFAYSLLRTRSRSVICAFSSDVINLDPRKRYRWSISSESYSRGSWPRTRSASIISFSLNNDMHLVRRNQFDSSCSIPNRDPNLLRPAVRLTSASPCGLRAHIRTWTWTLGLLDFRAIYLLSSVFVINQMRPVEMMMLGKLKFQWSWRRNPALRLHRWTLRLIRCSMFVP